MIDFFVSHNIGYALLLLWYAWGYWRWSTQYQKSLDKMILEGEVQEDIRVRLERRISIHSLLWPRDEFAVWVKMIRPLFKKK